MKLKKFLKYNGIMLIDPMDTFHASCAAFYAERGFLSPRQIQALKAYCFSPEDIERLTSKTSTPTEEPAKTPNVIVESDVVKRRPTLPKTIVAKPTKKPSKRELKKQQKEVQELF